MCWILRSRTAKARAASRLLAYPWDGPGDFKGNWKLDAAIGTAFGVTLLMD